MDDEEGEEGDEDGVTQVAETFVGIQGPNDAVIVTIKKGTVLLEDGLVCIFGGVVFGGCAAWVSTCGGYVGSCCT